MTTTPFRAPPTAASTPPPRSPPASSPASTPPRGPSLAPSPSSGTGKGNCLVIETTYYGEVLDTREETYYWPEGLWASAGTGASAADIAATMLDEYEQCHSIRVARDDEDYTPNGSDDDEY